jgi:biotin carboxyl carrier protein
MTQIENMDFLNIDETLYKTRLSKQFKNRKSFKTGNPLFILSFIPGTVLDILVKPGQVVKKGDDLMILDAMKMQNLLKSQMDGKVKNIPVNKGDKVSKGTVLMELE